MSRMARKSGDRYDSLFLPLCEPDIHFVGKFLAKAESPQLGQLKSPSELISYIICLHNVTSAWL